MVTISSTANSSFHQLHTFNSENNNNHLYDPTFSPYLNGNEGIIVGKLGEPSQKLSPFISNRKSPLQKLEKKEENGEIGVFGAEKYFSEGEVETPRSCSIATPRYLHQRDELMAVATRKHTLQYGTPSIRSESTSNSQSALLQSGMRDVSRNRKDKGQAKGVLAGLGFKCSCSDKDSVDAGEISFSKTATYGAVHGKTTPRKLVDIAALDASHSIKISKPNPQFLKINDVYFQKQENFGVGLNSQRNSLAFSTMSPGSGNQNHLVKMQHQLDEEAQPRKSLEVFGSPMLKNKIKSLSFDRTRRLVMPSRDGTPRMEEIDSNYINDAASDASSDLFEIESIKSKTNPFLARQTSDAASSCVSPTTCYAPSEASIEWSVATASAAVMSDCEEQMSEVTIRSPIRTSFTTSNGKAKATREVQRRRPSMLLGCKSHKSVRVAGDAFITYENPSSTPKLGNRTNTSQVARFPSEAKLGNFGAKHGQQHHAYATPPLQHSHSPHASKLLYI
ncbi:PHYTOCHROME KINASE SUBSTRATE 1 [Spatholobus suberectus]|nr:PHYTOCHROME KINASE SUBSTRATE 1 [Spatholobus suberectus]